MREFVERAFACVGRSIEWRGKGAEEAGVDAKTGKDLVRIDPRYFRPTEVDELLGDASKARAKLGWKPQDYVCRAGCRNGGGDLQAFKQEQRATIARLEQQLPQDRRRWKENEA